MYLSTYIASDNRQGVHRNSVQANARILETKIEFCTKATKNEKIKFNSRAIKYGKIDYLT